MNFEDFYNRNILLERNAPDINEVIAIVNAPGGVIDKYVEFFRQHKNEEDEELEDVFEERIETEDGLTIVFGVVGSLAGGTDLAAMDDYDYDEEDNITFAEINFNFGPTKPHIDKPNFRDYIFHILVHELTHALDPSNKSENNNDLKRIYHKRDTEKIAFMQELWYIKKPLLNTPQKINQFITQLSKLNDHDLIVYMHENSPYNRISMVFDYFERSPNTMKQMRQYLYTQAMKLKNEL